MKTLFHVVALLCFGSISFSQQIFFPRANYADSTSLAMNVPTLAKEVSARYRVLDTATYFDNLFRLQIVAEDYSGSEQTLDAYSLYAEPDTSLRKAIGFAYRAYTRAMAYYEQGKSRPFRDIYNDVFTQMHRSFSDRAALDAGLYFNFGLANYKKAWDEYLTQQKNLREDSLSLKDALILCRNYCSWVVFSRTGSLGTLLLAKLEGENYISNDSVLVRMPDGGTVSVTVVRRRGLTVPQPVILFYTIYTYYPGFDLVPAKDAVQRGYVGVVANTRGKRLSQDVPEPFEHDAKDAYEIIDWISKQPWCNGSVGMYGGSYLGFAQWSATKYIHPALKTIVPQVAVGVGIDYPMQNNVFMSYMLQWIHYVVNNKYTDETEFRNSGKWDSLFATWYRSGRSFRALDTLEGRPNNIFHRWLDHPSYDKYWQGMTPQMEEFARINIPVLTVTGYWDDDQLGALYYYRQHHRWNTHANNYLLIGPYDHGGAEWLPRKELLGYKIDSVANIPIGELVFQWFDHVLKDSSMPAILSDRVNYEIMGTNEWTHVSSLDKMNNDTLTFYLDNTITDNHYTLRTLKPSIRNYVEEKVDFRDRTYIEPSGEDVGPFITLVDSVLHPGRKLVFLSDPLQQTTTISGSFVAFLEMAVNKKDVDVVIDLYAQMPDGTYLALNENVQRASFAHDRATRQPLQPNKTQHIQLTNTFLTSIRLAKGSRIILMVGVNLNPQWQINYGTGKDVSDESMADAGVPLKIKWYNVSTIRIPVWK